MQVHINQKVDWDSAPSSLVYYFATIVGDMPDALLRLLPVETQELLRSVSLFGDDAWSECKDPTGPSPTDCVARCA